jgi:hypothetical protein
MLKNPSFWAGIALVFLLGVALLAGYVQQSQQPATAPIQTEPTQFVPSEIEPTQVVPTVLGGTIAPFAQTSSVPPTVLAIFPTATPRPPVVWKVGSVYKEIDLYSGQPRVVVKFFSSKGEAEGGCIDPQLPQPRIGDKYRQNAYGIFLPIYGGFQRFLNLKSLK